MGQVLIMPAPRISRLILRKFSVSLASVVLLVLSVYVPALAQNTAVARVPSSLTAPEDTVYRIGPGDVLTILVGKSPELSVEAVRVDSRGLIRIPMVDNLVPAACQTENELAARITKLYLEYKNNPNVQVFVRDFQSQPVSVIGAVNNPNQFRLQRRVRLLELLSYAGGPSQKAGRVVNIIHTGFPNICEGGELSNAALVQVPQELITLQLIDTLQGKDAANPFVKPGDMISVPEADQVFVVGYVYQPTTIPLKDKTITVSRAVAMAGGPQRDSKTSAIRIIRQTSDGGGKVEIPIDLKAIERKQAVDVVLIPNDIVDVPSSAGKRLLNALTGAIAPTIANTTLRAIP